MGTKSRTQEEKLSNLYLEYIYSITRSGFYIVLLNRLEEVKDRPVLGRLPEDIKKLYGAKNEYILNLKDILNDKDARVKSFEELMELRSALTGFAEDIIAFVSLCSAPLEALEEEAILRRIRSASDLMGVEPDYTSIYNDCTNLFHSVQTDDWENYVKCRLFSILPFKMAKLKFYDYLERALMRFAQNNTAPNIEKLFRVQKISLDPKGTVERSGYFREEAEEIERISRMNPAEMTDDEIAEALDGLTSKLEFLKDVLEASDEVYKNLGLLALIFCQGVDFEYITGNDGVVRDYYYLVAELGRPDMDDPITAEKFGNAMDGLLELFERSIDHARETREKIAEAHKTTNMEGFSESFEKIQSFAGFAESIYYGNVEDALTDADYEARQEVTAEYAGAKINDYMDYVRGYTDGLSPKDRKKTMRKLLSALYIPMEKDEFLDYFVDTLKSVGEGERNLTLSRLGEILDNEGVRYGGECSCGHHHEHDEDCSCGHHHEHDEDCSCGHHHEHDEDCSCGHHHEHDEDCSCGHGH